MDAQEKCPSCGAVSVDRQAAGARLTDYLARETGAPREEARRRADDILALVGGGATFGLLASLRALTEHWWLFALRGVLAVLFGILALVEPYAALAVLVLVFGVWAFIDGIEALALAISGWRSWQLVVGGLVGIAVGLFTFFRPGVTAFALYALIAAWAIARGILEIALAVELRHQIKNEVWLGLAGVASIVFGALMIILPVAGVLALAWLLGVYALVFGVLVFLVGLRLRAIGRRAPQPAPPARAATPLPA